MTFELLPTVTPWIVGFFALAAVAAVLAVAAVVAAVGETRRTRVARHESVRRYYGRVLLGH